MSKRKRTDSDSQDDFLPKRINVPATTQNDIFTVKNVEAFLRRRDGTRYQRAREITADVNHRIKSGNEIQAGVDGSLGRYSVRIVFLEGAPIDRCTFSCSCPDYGNPCKHAGAVLLCYARDPGSFKDTQSIRELVQAQEKEVLVDLLVALADKNQTNARFINNRLGGGTDDDDDDDDYEDESDDERYESTFE